MFDALEHGYLVNSSQRDRSYDLDVGDPLPGHDELLPSRDELAEVFGQCSATVRSATEHETPISTADSGECSVRSVDSGIDADVTETYAERFRRDQ